MTVRSDGQEEVRRINLFYCGKHRVSTLLSRDIRFAVFRCKHCLYVNSFFVRGNDKKIRVRAVLGPKSRMYCYRATK